MYDKKQSLLINSRKAASIMMTTLLTFSSTFNGVGNVYASKLENKKLDIKIDSEAIIDTLLFTDGQGLELNENLSERFSEEDTVDTSYESILDSLKDKSLVGHSCYNDNLDIFLVVDHDDYEINEDADYMGGYKNPLSIYRNGSLVESDIDDFSSELEYDLDTIDTIDNDDLNRDKLEIASSIRSLDIILLNSSSNINYNLDVEIDNTFVIDSIDFKTINITNGVVKHTDSNAVATYSNWNDNSLKASASNATESNATRKENTVSINLKPMTLLSLNMDLSLSYDSIDSAFDVNNTLIIHSNLTMLGITDEDILYNAPTWYSIRLGALSSGDSIPYTVYNSSGEVVKSARINNYSVITDVHNGDTIEIYNFPSITDFSISEYWDYGNIGNDYSYELFRIDYENSSIILNKSEVLDVNTDTSNGIITRGRLDFTQSENNILNIDYNLHMKYNRYGEIRICKNTDAYDSENINLEDSIFLYTIEKIDEPSKGTKFTTPLVVYSGGTSGYTNVSGLYPGWYRITEESTMRYQNFFIDVNTSRDNKENYYNQLSSNSIEVLVLDDCNYITFTGGMASDMYFSNTSLNINSVINNDGILEFIRQEGKGSGNAPCNLDYEDESYLPIENYKFEYNDIEEKRLA